MSEKILTESEFTEAYIDFYGNGYLDIIKENYIKYKNGSCYSNKSMFIQNYFDRFNTKNN